MHKRLKNLGLNRYLRRTRHTNRPNLIKVANAFDVGIVDGVPFLDNYVIHNSICDGFLFLIHIIGLQRSWKDPGCFTRYSLL